MFKEINLIVSKLKPESYVLYYDPSTMEFVTRWNGDWVDHKENRAFAPLVNHVHPPNLVIRNYYLTATTLSDCNTIQVISEKEAEEKNLKYVIGSQVGQGGNVHWLAYHPLKGFSKPLSDVGIAGEAHTKPADTFTYDYQGTQLIGLVYRRSKKHFSTYSGQRYY